ncbi:DNA cytosine methyltransferase [Aeromonas caviae]|jgi:DNA (cytosine-5)-methyltransferase 1|uniref:DNA cytosine methyltransferase n=1 Tax=Aeromonas TaxID=642 RepID=UPI0009B81418|nr:DNA cytosine methyltransferase [Aeromonas caviae]
MATLACIDLFCGAGGLTHGLTSEGIPVVAGIDVDPACRHPFETNNGATFIKEDVSHSTPEMLQNLFGDAEIRILAGCAPCQPFSTYSQRYDTVGSQRWSLLNEFARLVCGTLPDIVTMENVPTVQKHEVYDNFVTTLTKLGYEVWHDIVDCSRYGLPQRRHRMVLLASRLGPIELIQPTQDSPRTVREAIGGLPAIAAGTSLSSDPLHTASGLSQLNLERIRVSRPGGTWRDWPNHLIADCHRRDTGRTYPGVYGRMSWNESAPTLTTQFYGFGNGRFGHPEQDRAISLREGAILQGFPADYSFVPEGEQIRFGALGRMIGNAVPVTLGKVIGRSILQHLAIQPLEAGTKE